MRKIIILLCPLILTAAGVLFIVLGINSLDSRGEYVPASGTISGIYEDLGGTAGDTQYYVCVKFDIDGEEYESVLGEYNSSMEEGQAIDILYDPNNPDTIVTASLFGDIMYICVGVICIAAASTLAIKQIRSWNK